MVLKGRIQRALGLAVACTLASCCGFIAFSVLPGTRLSGAQLQRPSASQRRPAEATSAADRASLLGLCSASAAVVAVLASGRRRLSHCRGAHIQCRALTAEEDLGLDSLLNKYAAAIKAIREGCREELDSYSDTHILRIAIEHQGDVVEAVKNAREILKWRNGEGRSIVESAAKAVEAATAEGGWNNEPVLAAAPHSAAIAKYLTSSQIVLVPLKSGDLCSCIRASAIDDNSLMNDVSVEQLIEFFLYAREVNNIVANARSSKSGRLVRLLAANDLTGVSKFPDSRFQEALTGSSKKATVLYPGLSGPTVILNLPGIVRLLVTFLTPLFPGAVQQKLKFARGPMAYLKDLKDVLKEPTRSMFIDDLGVVLSA